MRPVALLHERRGFVVVHECTGCGARRRCRTAPDDDRDVLLR
jgi:hypothetical protein